MGCFTSVLSMLDNIVPKCELRRLKYWPRLCPAVRRRLRIVLPVAARHMTPANKNADGRCSAEWHYGNTNPDRAFTAEMSVELIVPEAFTSNLKFDNTVACPDSAFTLLISLALTARELLKSPTRKPIETGCGFTVPLGPVTPVSVIVTRLLSISDGIFTMTSLPDGAAVALTVADAPSTTATLATVLIVLLNWK